MASAPQSSSSTTAQIAAGSEIPLHLFDKIAHVRTFTNNSVRFDGRSFGDFRPVRIITGNISSTRVCGSSQVQIGHTLIACGVNILIGNPSHLKPDCGDIVCEVTLGTLGPSKQQDRLQSNKKDAEAYELENHLLKTLNSGNVVDLTQLCIQPATYAFRLQLNVVCLNNGGNLKDAMLLAAMAALRCTKIPAAIISSANSSSSVAVSMEKAKSLVLKNSAVLSVTVGIVDSHLLIDPSIAEEEVLHASLTCTFMFDTSSGSQQLLTYTVGTTEGNEQGGLAGDTLAQAMALCSTKANTLKSAVGW